MTKHDYRRIATVLREQRKLWQGYNEAQAGIDGVIVALAREYAARSPDKFRVSWWIDTCGTALIMGWLPASIARYPKGPETNGNNL